VKLIKKLKLKKRKAVVHATVVAISFRKLKNCSVKNAKTHGEITN
jgi:hypothetical protein